MKKNVRLKFKFIKKYEVDLWGYLTSCPNEKHFFKKMFKTFCVKYKYKIKILRYILRRFFKNFMYSKNISKKKKSKLFKKDYIINLHTLLKFRIYYGDMTIKRFKCYLNKINKRRIDFFSKISFLLEGRLDIILFRLNLVKNARQSRQFIKKGLVLVNNTIITKANHQLYLNDILSMKCVLAQKLRQRLQLRLEKKKTSILFNYPKYLEVNYKLMKCIFLKYPKKKEIPYLFSFDLSFLRNIF